MKKILWKENSGKIAAGIVLAALVIGLIAGLAFNQKEIEKSIENTQLNAQVNQINKDGKMRQVPPTSRKFKEAFEDPNKHKSKKNSLLSAQPLYFPEQKYMTGGRQSFYGGPKRCPCQLSWRDCKAFQKCTDGQCAP